MLRYTYIAHFVNDYIGTLLEHFPEYFPQLNRNPISVSNRTACELSADNLAWKDTGGASDAEHDAYTTYENCAETKPLSTHKTFCLPNLYYLF
jgi:hypothetical protein